MQAAWQVDHLQRNLCLRAQVLGQAALEDIGIGSPGQPLALLVQRAVKQTPAREHSQSGSQPSSTRCWLHWQQVVQSLSKLCFQSSAKSLLLTRAASCCWTASTDGSPAQKSHQADSRRANAVHALQQRCKQSCVVGVVQVVVQEVGDVEHAPVQRLQVAGQAVQLPTLGQQQLKHQLQDLQGTGITGEPQPWWLSCFGRRRCCGEYSGKCPGHATALSRPSEPFSANIRFSRSVFGHVQQGSGTLPQLASLCQPAWLISAGRAMQISGTSVCKQPTQCCCVSLKGCCQSQEQPHQEVQLLIPVQDPLPALLYICGGAQQPAWPLHIFTVLP